MKKLDEYLAMPYRVEIIRDEDEGGYVASFPDLPGCLTCGETIESVLRNALDAEKIWLEAAIEEGIQIKEPETLDCSLNREATTRDIGSRVKSAKGQKKDRANTDKRSFYLFSNNDAVCVGSVN